MNEEQLSKALEVWGLQVMLDVSILLGLAAAGLALVQGYYRALEKRLTLRVSVELWQVLCVLAVDLALVIAVGVGYLLLNPDIMSDVKMAVPFYPAAVVLLAAALVLRLFHGGHEPGSRASGWSLALMLLANAVNVLGFTFVMEGPGKEYMARHASPFWDYLQTHLRSNADPFGIDLSQATFYVCFPLLVAVTIWGAAAGLRNGLRRKGG